MTTPPDLTEITNLHYLEWLGNVIRAVWDVAANVQPESER